MHAVTTFYKELHPHLKQLELPSRRLHDAPVVAIGERTPLGFTNTQPDLSKGIHSGLYNNAWGTNYIMWYGEDMRFRYVLHL